MISRLPTKEQKTRSFTRFYAGWRSFCRGLPDRPPGAWPSKDRDLWLRGFRAASREAAKLRGSQG